MADPDQLLVTVEEAAAWLNTQGLYGRAIGHDLLAVGRVMPPVGPEPFSTIRSMRYVLRGDRATPPSDDWTIETVAAPHGELLFRAPLLGLAVGRAVSDICGCAQCEKAVHADMLPCLCACHLRSTAAVWLHLQERAAAEQGKHFLGRPERWLDRKRWRCRNDHVSSTVLKSEAIGGNLCLQCHDPALLTFPEDVDGPLG